MILANFHTHSGFCDGEGDPEKYVQEALKRGFRCLGFTGHGPLPFYQSFVMQNEQLEDYCACIKALKGKYQDRIQLYLGLEVDYIPGVAETNRFRDLNLDYTIGSIHLMQGDTPGEFGCVDESDTEFDRVRRVMFAGDIRSFVKAYYALIRDMVQADTPDVIGHLDVIKKFNTENKYFVEDAGWYRKEVLDTLEAIAASSAVLEVNTGGIARGYIKEPYPSPWILRECKHLGIPIMLNSDAHSPQGLTAAFSEVLPLILGCGYSEQRIIVDETWQDVSLV